VITILISQPLPFRIRIGSRSRSASQPLRGCGA